MKKQNNRGLIWSFVVIFLILLFDQILKIWVKTSMTLGQEIPVIGNWFNLLFIENNGMAFGWLGGGGFLKLALSIFRIVAIIALFWVLVRLSKKNTKFGVLFGIALITAGAMGNIIDSVFYGRIFSESTYTQVATLFPDGGGYAGWLHLKYLANIAVERHCGRMEWICLDWNAPSLAFYRSIGAIPMDEWTVQRMHENVVKTFAK